MRIFLSFLALYAGLSCAAWAQSTGRAAESQARTGEVANLPAQPIGGNDLLDISVYDSPEMSHTIRVGADGLIRIPMLQRPIRAQGLMPAELEEAIAREIKAEQILVEPVVTVTIIEYQSHPITVVGAVKIPITFQASKPTTLLEALTTAGGPASEAGSEVLVRRSIIGPDGKTVAVTQRIPLRALEDGTDSGLNIVLHGGEEVRVPEAGKIYIVGQVKKPGAYPVQEGGQTTLLQLLALSEGLDAMPKKQAYIYRNEAGSKNEIPVDLKSILQRRSPDVALLPNDILYIPEDSRRKNTLTALDRFLIFGSAVGSAALVYGLIR